MSLLRHAGCLLLGAAVGVAAVVVHRAAFPVGLLLSLATTVAVPWRLIRSARRRTAASYTAGWLAVFAGVLVGRPEGDYVVAADPSGYSLIAAALALVVLAVVSLAGGRGRGT